MLMLDDGAIVESLLGTDCQRPVFMVNSLFLYFCLSMLGTNNFLVLKNPEVIGGHLKNYILGRIDCVQLELSSVVEVYPALNLSLGKKEIICVFLLQTLSGCQNVKDLILTPDFGLSVKEVLSTFKNKYQNLNSIRLVNGDDEIGADVISAFEPGDLSVIIHNQSGQCVDELLEFIDTIERESCVYVFGGDRSKPMIDLSTFTRPNVRKLYIRSSKKDRLSYLAVKQDIPMCSKLTHIFIPDSYFMIGEETVEALSKAIQNGRFPKFETCHDV